jgi:hypothetical protein
MIHRGPGFLVSRHRMIWLLPLPPILPSVSSTGDAQEHLEREATCLRERGGGAKGGRESLVLHKSFTSLCTLSSCLKGQSLFLKVFKMKSYTCRDGTALDQNF